MKSRNYTDVGDKDNMSVNSEQPKSWFPVSYILCILKFLSVNRDRPGVFVGTYLLLAGWKEKRIGHVTFIRSMISLFVQTPVGDLIDKSKMKREYFFLATAGVTLSGLSLAYNLEYYEVSIAMAVQGVALALIAPSIYGLTLGLVGSEQIGQQTSMNEMSDHAGTVIFASMAGANSILNYFTLYDISYDFPTKTPMKLSTVGILAYFYDDIIIFWVVFIMAIASVACVYSIKSSLIDDDRARGLNKEDENTKQLTPVSYSVVFQDRNILVLLATVFLFHFGNAAMLPLLSQMLAVGGGRSGIPFTAACIVISQATMVPTASWVGSRIKYFGSKQIFIGGLSIIPIRGLLVVIFYSIYPSQELLLTTQILDGLSSGIYAVLCVLLTEELTRGSGRFNFVFGLVNTAHAVGDAFSNLTGEHIAETSGYKVAFIVLAIIACMPIILFSLLLKPLPQNEGSVHMIGFATPEKNTQGDVESVVLSPLATEYFDSSTGRPNLKAEIEPTASPVQNPLNLSAPLNK